MEINQFKREVERHNKDILDNVKSSTQESQEKMLQDFKSLTGKIVGEWCDGFVNDLLQEQRIITSPIDVNYIGSFKQPIRSLKEIFTANYKDLYFDELPEYIQHCIFEHFTKQGFKAIRIEKLDARNSSFGTGDTRRQLELHFEE